MSVVYCGIDEAGYGPLLGPLCVGMVALRASGWTPGEPAPDLWAALERAVCRAPGDRRARIPVADSKRLKGPNSLKTRHPLTHLEHGVLAFLAQRGPLPADDAALFDALGAGLDERPWYAGPPTGLPVGRSLEEIRISASLLAGAMAGAGVEVLDVRCAVVGESRFNDLVRASGTKAATTGHALAEHLAHARRSWGDGPGALRIVCDRQGGRTDYARLLERALGGPVEQLERSERASRYRCRDADLGVLFLPEAESRHLPVALASMAAKLVRELAMARLNRYWCGLMPELKPTAGYTADGRRWLRDVAGVLSADDRRAMVRLA